MADLEIGPLRRKADWAGLLVETRRPMQNGYTRIAEGTRLIVARNYSGLELRGVPCETCGVAVLINRVAERDVQIVRRLADPGDTTSFDELLGRDRETPS